MIIHSKLVYQWCDRIQKYILVEDISYPFNGQVELCKGASAQQTQIGQSQQNFMNTLQSDYGTAFAGQQNILNNLTSSLSSTLQNGPGQYGYSAPETAALNTLATSGNAAQYQSAKQAAGAASDAAGGGNTVLPSSAANQTQATIASQAAQNQSNALLGIKTAEYQQGNANYNTALSGLTSAAGLENPSGVASTANQAGSGAANTSAQITQENNAASPWNVVGGILGGLGGAVGTGLSTALTGGTSSAIPMLNTTGGSDPLGLNSPDVSPPNTNDVAGGLAPTGFTGMPSF